ncbi:MAG TPA: hypothetical protein VFS27_07870 [Blastocatellia bacterium]|nr:hypothetical protein [Blastocatellia bacterium]
MVYSFKTYPQARWLFFTAVMWALLAIVARAQDQFEIQVYEYETVPKGKWNLETHINYVGKGTKFFEGPVAPTNNQFHLTFELTRGITNLYEAAGYLLTAHRPGAGYEFAGWRFRNRVRAPKSWKLPVDLSVSAEFDFPQRQFEENSVALEIRPIIEKKFGRFQYDINPILDRALSGPGTKEGWTFQPCMRLGYTLNKRLDLSMEYYSDLGPLTDLLPPDQQGHQFYPGGDLKFGENTVITFGVGFGATHMGNRLIYKIRIGHLFSRHGATPNATPSSRRPGARPPSATKLTVFQE